MNIYTGNDDTLRDLSNDDIVMGTFVYDESSICSGTIDVGATYSNGIEFALQNFNGRFNNIDFSNARIEVHIGLLTSKKTASDAEEEANDYWVYVPLGIFFVTNQVKKLSTVSIKALDRMYMLNKELQNVSVQGASLTLRDYIDNISTHFGFSLEEKTYSLVQGYTQLRFFNSEKELTCRDFIGYASAIFGKSARFNRAGKLEFFGISDTVYETDSSIRSSLSKSDYIVDITDVEITDAHDKTHNNVPEKSKNYVITVGKNPLLETEQAVKYSLKNISHALIGMSYRPYQCTLIGDPCIQCGDRVKHIDKNGQTFTSIITNFKFRFRGPSDIEAKGEEPQSSRQMTSTEKKIVEVRQSTAEDLNNGLDSMEKMILKQTELLSSSTGIYRHQSLDSDGNVIGYYLSSSPDKDDETATVWAYTDEGIGVSHNGISGPFTSSWTADDSIVAKIITADMIKTGTLSAIDETLKIDLNNGTFETKTALGICKIFGNEILLEYHDKDTGIPVSYMRLSADSIPDDKAVNMKIAFESEDHSVSSYIEQKFEYDSQTGIPSRSTPLTISSTGGVVADKTLHVRDSILYDHIIMQRRYHEPENTGVDFVVCPNSIIPPENLFRYATNPGFEFSEDSCAPWVKSGRAFVSSEKSHTGSYSLRLGYEGWGSCRAPIKTPNKDFYIGFWYIAVATDGRKAEVKITPTEEGASSTIIFSADVINNKWEYFSTIVENDCEQYIDLFSELYVLSYWDDFFMCESDGYTKEQLDEYVMSLY